MQRKTTRKNTILTLLAVGSVAMVGLGAGPASASDGQEPQSAGQAVGEAQQADESMSGNEDAVAAATEEPDAASATESDAASADATVTGMWKDVPWTFDEDTETLTLHGSTDPEHPLQLGLGRKANPNSQPCAGNLSLCSPFPGLETAGYKVTKLVFENPKGIQVNPVSASFLTWGKDLVEIDGINDLNTELVGTGLDHLGENNGLYGAFENLGSNMPNDTIESLDLSNWNVSEVNSLWNTFRNANIASIDVTGWDTSKVKNMSYTFACPSDKNYPCNTGSGLKEIIGLNTWDTSAVTNMTQTFRNHANLETLDLSSWDTRAAFDNNKMNAMLSKLPKLQELILGENTKLADDVMLSTPTETDEYTGAWVRLGEDDVAQGPWWRGTGQELATHSQEPTTAAGTYVWQEKANVVFELNGGEWAQGDEPSTVTGVGDLLTYSAPVREDYVFDGWIVSYDDTLGDSQRSGDAAVRAGGEMMITQSGTTTFNANWKKVAKPEAPTVKAADKCGVDGTVVIPTVEGIEYSQIKDGTKVTVTASAADGYVLADDAVTEWMLDIKGEACPGAGSGGSTGGLAVTGASAISAATAGLALLAGGAFLVLRNRAGKC